MRWNKEKKHEASKGEALGENRQITKTEFHLMHTRVVQYNDSVVSTWFYTATISSDIYSDYTINFKHFA